MFTYPSRGLSPQFPVSGVEVSWRADRVWATKLCTDLTRPTGSLAWPGLGPSGLCRGSKPAGGLCSALCSLSPAQSALIINQFGKLGPAKTWKNWNTSGNYVLYSEISNGLNTIIYRVKTHRQFYNINTKKTNIIHIPCNSSTQV